MSLSLLLALATGATAVAQESGSGSTTSGHRSGLNETAEASSNTGTDDTSTEAAVGDDTTSTTNKANEHATTMADHQARLTAVKLKVCEKRSKNITNIMSRISDRGQKQLDLFTAIATKTEAFYVSKGNTLTNYQALVDAVNAKQTAAKTTVDTIKADSANFSCSGSDSQGSIATFKTALKSEIQALKDYKTAVKNLIVGVKSVQSDNTAAEAN
jgi:hypothetical protein